MSFQVLAKEIIDEFVQRIWVNKNGEIQVEWKFQDLFLKWELLIRAEGIVSIEIGIREG